MTVQLATTQDARREIARARVRERTYSGPGFGPRSFAGIGIGIGIDVGSPVAATGGFNGRFATLFPGAYQVAQTDLGLTYGGTLHAKAGNTSTATMALSGALATTPVPIRIVLTGAGVTANIYYDGAGVTPAMTGVSVVATVPIVLTGAAIGLSITPSAGALVAGDSWDATCAGLADQSGNALNFAQATASKQMIVTPGLNGKAFIASDGVSQNLVSLLTLPAPGTTPYYCFAVFRQLTWVPFSTMWGRTSNTPAIGETVFQSGSSPALASYSGTAIANSGAAIGAFVIAELTRSNSAGDTHKFGSTTVIGNSGNNASVGLEIASATGAGFGSLELAALVHTSNQPNWVAVRAAVNSAAGYGAGNVLT